ncbi:MAG: DNA mismatch endonuclease Vsr [Chloroflexota bacterium]|nr:DNA mismatch endonuclease Vsr [Chloroflexota bacterium]
MTDTVSAKKRSEVMSRVGSKDTKPELLIRKGLHARGFRYRLHVKELPGKPDLVFPRYKSIIQINGCFWHGHSCDLYRFPKSNTEYWKEKIKRNVERDISNIKFLTDAGWRILIIWECAIKRKARLPMEKVLNIASEWLLSEKPNCEIAGLWEG